MYSNQCVADKMRMCILCFWCRMVVDCFFFCLSEPKRRRRHSAFKWLSTLWLQMGLHSLKKEKTCPKSLFSGVFNVFCVTLKTSKKWEVGSGPVKLLIPLILSKEVRLTSLLCVQESGHFSVISVEPRLLKRATCSATSSCTRGRNPLNVLSAATPVEEGTRSLATFALTQVEQIKAWDADIFLSWYFTIMILMLIWSSLQYPLQLWGSLTSAVIVAVVTSSRAP